MGEDDRNTTPLLLAALDIISLDDYLEIAGEQNESTINTNELFTRL